VAVDVVVVGAGIAGVSVALELAERDVAVHLLDRAEVAGGSTGAGEGNVLLCDKVPGPELELAKLGHQLYDELEERYPDVARIRRKGALLVYPDADAVQRRDALAAAMAAEAVACVPLDGDEARAIEPELAPDIAGALLFPTDLQCDPLGITRAAGRALRGLGGTVQAGTPVRAVRAARGRIQGVETDDGFVACPTVVLAAGAWTAPLAQSAGIRLPVEPRKGQLVMTEAAPDFVRHKVLDASYADTVASADPAAQVATVLETSWRGAVLVGSSRERVGFDDTVSDDVTAELLRRGRRLMPGLARLRVTDAWVGFRPYLPDHLPAVGPSRAVEGLWVSTGHEGAGIALGPISGRLVARAYCGEPLPIDLAPFAPDRFQ
jgi:D-hydroxyproline dehydrogenase subunit beta